MSELGCGLAAVCGGSCEGCSSASQPCDYCFDARVADQGAAFCWWRRMVAHASPFPRLLTMCVCIYLCVSRAHAPVVLHSLLFEALSAGLACTMRDERTNAVVAALGTLTLALLPRHLRTRRSKRFTPTPTTAAVAAALAARGAATTGGIALPAPLLGGCVRSGAAAAVWLLMARVVGRSRVANAVSTVYGILLAAALVVVKVRTHSIERAVAV